MAQSPAKEEAKKNRFDWADEGLSAILTLNYVSIPGIPQRQIDPTFIASVFTTTLATFGVQTGKKKEEKPKEEEKKDAKVD